MGSGYVFMAMVVVVVVYTPGKPTATTGLPSVEMNRSEGVSSSRIRHVACGADSQVSASEREKVLQRGSGNVMARGGFGCELRAEG